MRHIPKALAARGESLAAFDGRCIPGGCVAPPSNTAGILSRRALPAGRLARLGATPDFHHGLLAALLAAAFLASTHALDLTAHNRATTRVAWNRDIAPIVQARCANCHARGGSSTIPLTTYEEARPWAASIKEEVLTRRMPVWKAARGYGDFANDPSLSPFEIALIAAWADGGAPEISEETNGRERRATPRFRPRRRSAHLRSTRASAGSRAAISR